MIFFRRKASVSGCFTVSLAEILGGDMGYSTGENLVVVYHAGSFVYGYRTTGSGTSGGTVVTVATIHAS